MICQKCIDKFNVLKPEKRRDLVQDHNHFYLEGKERYLCGKRIEKV